MAKNFGKLNNSKIEAVAKKSNEQANLITIKYYEDSNLIDYPENNEDVSYTEDIELSISEQGFTDPIEVTDFGMDEGKYMIISGHRRRMAGRKQGLKSFPCIVRHLKTENEVKNYVLLSNAQRDSAKDPLLFSKRYKMHEDYLKSVGFKGSVREEVAKRLGLKVAQADRYNQINKVIMPFWDLIRSGAIGISSVTDSGLYTHTVEEQEEMLEIFNEALEQEIELNRSLCKKIVTDYRNGKKSWEEIKAEEKPIMNLPITDDTSDEKDNGSDEKVNPLERNNEVNYDTSHREDLPSGKDPYADERMTEDDYDVIENANEGKDKEEKPKDIQFGEKILKALSNLESMLDEIYKFETDEKYKLAVRTFGTMSEMLIDNMEAIAGDTDYDKSIIDICVESLNSIEKDIKRIKKAFSE